MRLYPDDVDENAPWAEWPDEPDEPEPPQEGALPTLDEPIPTHPTLAGLVILPGLATELERVRLSPDPSRLDRLQSYASALGATQPGDVLHATHWWREPSGRIHIGGDELPVLQNVARTLRPFIGAVPGYTFISGDYASGHMWIAAALSQDHGLLSVLQAGDVYAAFADRLGCSRDDAKIVALSILNGQTIRGVAGKLHWGGTPAKHLMAAWDHAFPMLRAYKARRAHEWVAGSFKLTPAWGRRPVARDSARKIIALDWLSGEARMLDAVLADIARGAALGWPVQVAMPLFDGLLIAVPSGLVDQGRRALAESMQRAAVDLIGMSIPVKIGSGATWAAAEEGAKRV